MDAELWKQPTPEKSAQDTNDEIANHTEPGSVNDLTGQPSCKEADNQYDQQAFSRHVHLRILQG
jgi:hypothetical protein